ncbi:MAG: agmatine deiminase family protein [Bacteroides sp.]|nr:agmatine deiminase family protein [Bacteroides sp.]
MKQKQILPAEWYDQSAVQLTWPHEHTDWAYMLKEVEECFINIAREISLRQTLIIATPNTKHVKKLLRDNGIKTENIILFEVETNDTWARDHGAITTINEEGEAVINDFTFNGWGMKFASNYDNLITREMVKANVIKGEYKNNLGFVLEGGSIESDGKGTILTTKECLMSDNRNEHMSKQEIEQVLADTLGAKRTLWLENGYLAGDDTDSHVDTLARLCDENTIAYVKCYNEQDEHFTALNEMEKELLQMTKEDGTPYRLIPLPLPDKIEFDGERLPATYANFLIMNGAVLVPTYNQPSNDKIAIERLQEVFTDREVIGIDCNALIKQHGSLHCVTMQYPKEVICK